MEALQRELVDEKRSRLIYFPPTSVGSIGFSGMAGLTVCWTPAGFALSRTSPGATGRDLISPWMIQSHRPTTRDLRPVEGGFRSRELEWRRTHKDELRRFANEWVALEGEEIVAHGKEPVQVVAEARAKGIQTPYVFYVEPRTEDVAMIGL